MGLGCVLGCLVGVDEVLPAGGAVAFEEGGGGLRDVEGGLLVVVLVKADAGEGGGGAAGVHAARFENVLGHVEHVAVEDEAGMAALLVGEGGELLGEVGGGVLRVRGETEGEGGGGCGEGGESSWRGTPRGFRHGFNGEVCVGAGSLVGPDFECSGGRRGSLPTIATVRPS